MSGGVVHVVGNRPHFPKLAAVLRAQSQTLSARTQIIDTGQHYDRSLSGVFFEDLGLPEPVASLGIGSGTAAEQTGRMLIALEATYTRLKPALVVVYGDTHSTLAGALAAAQQGLPCVHVEAGLRTFDRSLPEEINRVLVDHLCVRLYAPTVTAQAQLEREGLADRTELTGDLLVEATLHARAQTDTPTRLLASLGLSSEAYGVLTLHRAANTLPSRLSALLPALIDTAARLNRLVWPLHPRTGAALAALEGDWPTRLAETGIELIEPLGPYEMLDLLANASLILTDSGGLQKEAFLLGTPCITLRDQTEWIETLTAGANRLAHDAASLRAALATHLAQPPDRAALRDQALVVYGGGQAGGRIAASLEKLLTESAR